MKKKKNNRLVILIIILILLMIVLFIYSQVSYRPEVYRPLGENNPKQVSNYQTPISVNEKWYHSSLLKFSILVPAGYTIEDQQITITLHNQKGDIVVSRVGTNFDNLNDYLQYLSMKNRTNLVDKQEIIINKLPAVKTQINYQNLEKKYIYFIYANGFIYSLATPSKPLSPDLDRIAQSFSYTP